MKLKAFTIYDDLGESIIRTIYKTYEEARDKFEDVVAQGKMPYESEEDAAKRKHIIEIEISFRKPKSSL